MLILFYLNLIKKKHRILVLHGLLTRIFRTLHRVEDRAPTYITHRAIIFIEIKDRWKVGNSDQCQVILTGSIKTRD